MVLPKYFLLTARKILILPKSSKLGGAIAPPAPPAGTAMNRTSGLLLTKYGASTFLQRETNQFFFLVALISDIK